MTVFVHGIGWLTQEGYGCVKSGLHHPFMADENIRSLAKRDMFYHPFKNFGRLDRISRMTVYAVALALRDAGMEYFPDQKLDIGIIGTNSKGSFESDIEYFRDYLDGGRTVSRGNLFIYTLPSSPLGEAAIHFGFTGPLLYTAGKENNTRSILDMAEDILLARETTAMLAGRAEAEQSLYFVLRSEEDHALCDLTEARTIVETESQFGGVVSRFLSLKDSTAGKA